MTKVIRGLENVTAGGRSALTLGAFDGVHRGHQALVTRTIESAHERGLSSLVLTFDPDPDRVVRPGRAEPLLTTTEERIELLTALRPDSVVVARFDSALAGTAAREFLNEILVETLGARHLVVGPRVAFGRGAAGNLDRLTEWAPNLDVTVEVVPELVAAGRAVSSSAIREALRAGDVTTAREMLGRPYSLRGVVERAHGRGRELGFPTANIAIDSERLAPADGVYAVQVALDGEQACWPGVASIGERPTFVDAGWALEVHLPGQQVHLYGRRLAVHFWAWLRGQHVFEGSDALAAQIEADVRHAQEALTALQATCDVIE